MGTHLGEVTCYKDYVKIEGKLSGTGRALEVHHDKVSYNGVTIIDSSAKIDSGRIKNVPASWATTVSTTAPTSPSAGDMWFDDVSNAMKVYNGNAWDQMSNKFTATGGTESTYTSGGTFYKVHTFTSSGTFTAESSGSVDVLVVAGGGASGASTGGGGGAGGLIYISGYALNTGTISVTVGAGGAGGFTYGDGGSGAQGGNSIFKDLIAYGGGRGGATESNNDTFTCSNGGSGGGASHYYSNKVECSATQPSTNGGYPNSGFGNNGGGGDGNLSDGGGGAGGAGGGNGNSSGGVGKAYDIRTGTPIYYAGGGAGGHGGAGGAGGGGNGGSPTGTAGAANTGGGGGGGWSHSAAVAQSGGSGIVIVRYTV